MNWTFVELMVSGYSVIPDHGRVRKRHVERAHLHHVEFETMQVEGMCQAVLNVNQSQIDDRVEFNFDPMDAVTELGVGKTGFC